MSPPAASAGAAPAPRWLPWAGALVGVAAIAWLLRGFDLEQFRRILAGADLRWVALIPLAILAEQLIRAWKWRQLLSPLRPIGTGRLFGAIMAGYLIAYLIPFGFGTLARAWLVARREQLKLPSVLATVALDRLTDGIVFALLVPLVLWQVGFEDPSGRIHTGLGWGAAISFGLFGAVLAALVTHRRGAIRQDSHLVRWLGRLPPKVGSLLQRFDAAFVQGIVWPQPLWRGVAVMLASLAIKLMAVTPLLLAGWAIGAELAPSQYLFVMVFLGFLLIMGHFLRLLGSFVVGGVFALGLFGVAPEPALAMILMVEAATLLSVAAAGALSMSLQGVALADVRADPALGAPAARS